MKFNWLNSGDKTRWIEVDQKGAIATKLDELNCPSCSDTVKRLVTSWLGKCKTCGALLNFLQGTPIQKIACAAETPVLANIGAVGSGKTTISGYIISNHMRMFPGAKVLAFALTLHQLKQFAIPEMDAFLHSDEFISKKESVWKMKNGSSIEFIASDNQEKIRSANATAIWLIEAASAKMKPIYKQGLTRLRNANAIQYAYNEDKTLKMKRFPNGKLAPVVLKNNTIMLVEANVKKGSWLKKELLKAHTIFHTTSVRGIPILKKQAKIQKVLSEFSGEEENFGMIAILNASVDNPTLTEDWFKSIRASMDTQEEYDREIFCDMTSEDGLVFKEFIPSFDKIFVPSHATYRPNQDLVFVESIDPGGSKEGNDATGYILGIFDKHNKVLKIIDGFKLSGKTLEEETVLISQIRDRHNWVRHRSFLFTGDSVLARTLKVDRHRSLKHDYELRLGVHIQVCTAKGIKQGVDKLKTWFKAEALTISDQLVDLKQELLTYEYVTKLEVVKGVPVDVQRFSVGGEDMTDALRYLIVELEGMGFVQDQHRIDAMRNLNKEINQVVRENYTTMVNKSISSILKNEFLPFPTRNNNSQFSVQKRNKK